MKYKVLLLFENKRLKLKKEIIKMIKLRPHHLLCTQGYSGKGYSDDFVENMDKIVDYLRNNEDAKIMLKFGDDDLCSRCPNICICIY